MRTTLTVYRLILITLLPFVCTSAIAEWVKVSDGILGSSIYANPASIHRNGSTVDMLDMTDFKSVQVFNGVAYLSLTAHSQYDCNEEMTRELLEDAYSGYMGNGKSVLNYGVREWHPISPHNASEALWKFACGTKCKLH